MTNMGRREDDETTFRGTMATTTTMLTMILLSLWTFAALTGS